MSELERFTQDFDKDYISLTDFSDLNPNRVIERLVSMSSNKLLRSIVFVSNQAKLSLVLLGKDSNLSILKKELTKANEKRKDAYSYNYHFIEEESQVKDIAETFLSNQ